MVCCMIQATLCQHVFAAVTSFLREENPSKYTFHCLYLLSNYNNNNNNNNNKHSNQIANINRQIDDIMCLKHDDILYCKS